MHFVDHAVAFFRTLTTHVTVCLYYILLFIYLFFACAIFKPDRGAKRPRGEEKGGSVGDDESRGVKHQKGHNARYREATSMGIEVGGEIRENEEMNGEKKMILEKLLDQDEEEPEVGGKKTQSFLSNQNKSFIPIFNCFALSCISNGTVFYVKRFEYNILNHSIY